MKDSKIFYSRYGDDLLIACTDLKTLEETLKKTQTELKRLSLQFHPDKFKKHFCCPSGTSKTESIYTPTPHIDYLGIRIHATQGLRLSRDKVREMIQPWVHSLHQTKNLLKRAQATESEITQVLVDASNAYFSKASSTSTPHLTDFYSWVNDETQIRELEDFLARTLTQIIFETRGTKAYQKLSWKNLIQKYGWKSPRYYRWENRQ